MLSRFQGCRINVNTLEFTAEFFLAGMLAIIRAQQDPLSEEDVFVGGVPRPAAVNPLSPLQHALTIDGLLTTDWRAIEAAIIETVAIGREIRNEQWRREDEEAVRGIEDSKAKENLLNQRLVARRFELIGRPLPSVFVDPLTRELLQKQFAQRLRHALSSQRQALEAATAAARGRPVHATLAAPVQAPSLLFAPSVDPHAVVRRPPPSVTVVSPARQAVPSVTLVPTTQELEARFLHTIGMVAGPRIKAYGEQLHAVQERLQQTDYMLDKDTSINKILNYTDDELINSFAGRADAMRNEALAKREELWKQEDKALVQDLNKLLKTLNDLQTEEYQQLSAMHAKDPRKHPRPVASPPVTINELRVGTGMGSGVLYHLTQLMLEEPTPAAQEVLLHRMRMLLELTSAEGSGLSGLADTFVDMHQCNALQLSVSSESWYTGNSEWNQRRLSMLRELLALLTADGVLTDSKNNAFLNQAVEQAFVALKDPTIVEHLIEQGGEWAELLLLSHEEYIAWNSDQSLIYAHGGDTPAGTRLRTTIFDTRSEAMRASGQAVEQLRVMLAAQEAATAEAQRRAAMMEVEEEEGEEEEEEEEKEQEDPPSELGAAAADESAERGTLLSLSHRRWLFAHDDVCRWQTAFVCPLRPHAIVIVACASHFVEARHLHTGALHHVCLIGDRIPQ
jgi:hypothetical protein